MARRISLQLDIVNSDRFANKVIESGHNKAKELPSWEYLNECFEYNEDTGELFWKERPLHHFKDTRCMNSWNVKFSKNRSGYVSKNTGYLLTGINDITFLNHRIIWKLLKKEEPPAIVDHIDNNSLNNRICNLRKASKSQNIRNRGKNKNNTTGFKGVQFSKKYKKFIAAIEYDGKLFHLGTFQTAEEASLAYQEKSIAIYKEFASISQAEYEENLKNTKISDKIRKGKGYWYNKVTNNYESYIQHNKKRIHLGTFDSVEDALYAYNQACLDLSGEFANTPVEEYREKIKKAKKAKQIC